MKKTSIFIISLALLISCFIIFPITTSAEVTQDQYEYSNCVLRLKSGDFDRSFFWNFPYKNNVTEITASEGVRFTGDFSSAFSNYVACVKMDFSKVDTSSVTDMSNMFFYCYRLKNLDISGFDTSNVTRMDGMFSGCSSITSLDVSGFYTSNVTRMNGMFSDCKAITTLDVSGFDTSSVTDMSGMFSDCKAITTLDVSGFDTSNVTAMGSMFSCCYNLKVLDVSGFDTSKVTNISSLFRDCYGLTYLNLSGFDLSFATLYYQMFSNCNSLSRLILPYGFGVRQDMQLNNGTWTAAVQGWRKAGTTEIISGNGNYAEFVSTGGEYVWFSETASLDAKLSIESKTVYSSDNTFTLDFVLENTELIKSVSLSDFTLNSSVFEIIGGEWKVANTEINDWDAANQIGAVAFSDNRDANGIIFELTLKIKENAPVGDYAVSCNIQAKKKLLQGSEENVDISVVNGTVTVLETKIGDVDGNGFVTSDDAIYLLYYTFLPDQFPVNQNCDFDGNGAVDSDDAIYLLYYTFLPDMFPLQNSSTTPGSVDQNRGTIGVMQGSTYTPTNADIGASGQFLNGLAPTWTENSVVSSSASGQWDTSYVMKIASNGTITVGENVAVGTSMTTQVTYALAGTSQLIRKDFTIMVMNSKPVSKTITMVPEQSVKITDILGTTTSIAGATSANPARASVSTLNNEFIITANATSSTPTRITVNLQDGSIVYIDVTVQSSSSSGSSTSSSNPRLTASSTNVRGGNSVTVTLSNATAFSYNWSITSESGETIATFENGKTEYETIATNTSTSLTIKTNAVSENQKITVHVAGYNNIEIASLQITVSK